jgi:hypothetical protein
MKLRAALLVSLISFGVCVRTASAQCASTVLQETAAQRQLEVSDVLAAPERVQGVVINRTDAVAKDVVLLVRYEWLWLNERKPGEDTMSFADTTMVAGDIPPGGTAGFAYMPTRYLPNRQDGHYRIEVSVKSFRKLRMERVPAN